MNKPLILLILGIFSNKCFAQVKPPKQKEVITHSETPKKHPYSLTLLVGLESNSRINITPNSPVYYPIGIASDYRLNHFFSVRGSVQARWFTDVPNEVSFGSMVETYALSFERNYNQYFLTLGPVFHLGNQWQWCISPQVGLKMAFFKT